MAASHFTGLTAVADVIKDLDTQIAVLTKKKLQDLVREVDPNEQLDEDVEEMLLQIADDFIESVVTAACQLARHRKSSTLEVKDVQLHLERQWNMWIPGFGSEEIRPYKKACTTEAHKQVRSRARWPPTFQGSHFPHTADFTL
ncbi:Transcription initiation factor TFIID subunit 12 [Sciurus carolinensis]|uniref:Transcription initiation factor TFIID subunit 12 n=1 Tax=Sciurus carolinensis TaxID=30640 RepID=A0AA41N1N2_SCICA|nr:Transcription initiation factor TFIID subunit 12 [Sciurus carolinensis]